MTLSLKGLEVAEPKPKQSRKAPAAPTAMAPKRSSSKAMHKRVRLTPIVATLRMVDSVGFVLDVDDVLTKNDRYRLVKMGGRMAQAESKLATQYKEAVRVAAVKCCGAGVLFGRGVRTGIWRLEVLSIWPTQRHHEDGTDTANGDSDAPIAMVKDALQHAGVIDDDMRIVGETTHAVYEKGVRRTVAILRLASPESHAAGVAAVLAVLG